MQIAISPCWIGKFVVTKYGNVEILIGKDIDKELKVLLKDTQINFYLT